LRTPGAKTLLAIVIVAAFSLGFVNVVRGLGAFESHAAYWTLNIALSVFFWLVLLRLCWRERRQRPR
jgi:phosphoglycerol transferase MdoB-like AlkP superfamily enzyme